MSDPLVDRQVRRQLAVLRQVEEVTGNVALTCRYFGISRQLYDTWLHRYQADGPEGLRPRSRRHAFLPPVARRWGSRKAVALWVIGGRPAPHPPPFTQTCRGAGACEPISPTCAAVAGIAAQAVSRRHRWLCGRTPEMLGRRRWDPVEPGNRSLVALVTGGLIVDQQTREQFFINALVTEHFVLQSARGAMIGEMVGRGSIYLGTVSSALIAFGFIAQTELRLAPFVAAVLPALFVLGELTFVALLRDSFQNIEFLRRIQKIRGYYRGLLPEAEEFFDPPGRDRETASEMATVGLGRGAALLFTGASVIAAVNSILGGAGLALLLAYTIRLDEAVVATVGVLAAVLLFGLHLAYEHWRGGGAGRPQP
jgi:hypothetical protein